MGAVKKILHQTKIPTPSMHYIAIELCETIHIHLGETRLEYTPQQFEKIASIFQKAYNQWIQLGKPEQDTFKLLADGYIPNPPVYQNTFKIEEQTIPSIHIHRRNISLRLNKQEYQQYTEALKEATKNLDT